MKTRTKKEIDAEIQKLRAVKSTVPKRTMFGDDNHGKIDAQIEALDRRMTEKQAELSWYQDETAEEFTDGDNDIYHDACAAIRWMNGDEDAPSEGWS